MKIGDLVRVDASIPEYVQCMGDTIGVIIDIGDCAPCTPPLTIVLWSNGATESLYVDELELVNVKLVH